MNPLGYIETGVIIRDDNPAVLQELPDECVDLIYLDPPFFSNRFYESSGAMNPRFDLSS